MKQILSIVFAALFAMRTTPPSQAQSGAVLHDVVVYGDSSGAVVAAISAKREGRSVILVNPTGFPGGMSASGLGATDFLGRRGTFGGIASELYEGIDAAYGKDFVASFEPKVGRQVFEKMIADTAGVRRGDTKPRVHYRQGDKDHFVKDVDPYVASIAAGLTLEKDTSLQDVACDPLRERLIAEKQIIQPGAESPTGEPRKSPRPKKQPSQKPNIVLILADDLGYGSLGCYGSTEIRTPNIDRLATGGVRLTDFHSNGTVCSPTRAALLTGRYPQRCAWVPDEELSPVFREQRKENPAQRWAWGISTGEITIAALLQKAGYRTGLIGKWHLGYDAKFHPMNYGFDEFRGFVGGNVDYHTHVAGYGLKELDWWNGKAIANEDGYSTDLLTKYATDFIARDTEQPFFLYLAHGAPHEPWQGRDASKNKAPAAACKEMIEALDDSVGAILGALQKHGLEENTLLIFCSDNGAAAPRAIAANGRLQGRKASVNEGGHRVPFIASWPGVIPAGKTSHATAMTMDLFPTFAKLAGTEPPPGHAIDGADMMPLLKNEAQAPERPLHWLSRDSWAVRKGPWKLIGKGQATLALVNVETDIEEKSNQLSENADLGNELLKLHRQWIESAGSR